MIKLIETALPLKELSQSAMGDKAHKGHPGNMHLWWNRSPIDSSAALLLAAVTDNPSEKSEEYPEAEEQCEARSQLMEDVKRIAGGAEDSKKLQSGELPVVCDPFSGFGGLAIATQKVGLKAYAGDLNAVATLLTKAAAEIPARFSDRVAVNPKAENMIYFGSEGLAADVDYYGKLVKAQAEERLVENYPKVSAGSDEQLPVYSWVWVRTVKCPNPACGCQMPLATSYTLSKLKGHEYWAEPEIIEHKVHFKIHQGLCPADKETNKHGSNGSKFQCPACGVITTDDYMKKAGKAGEMKIQLMAVSAMTSEGRIFLEPDAQQIQAADVALPEDLPIGSLPNNTRWFGPPGFGKTEYTDLYTTRQLLLMSTLCDLITEVQQLASKDAATAGMEEGESLASGGSGALAYGQAIGVYLALVIGKLANFQSEVCTWDNRNGNVRAAFTRQAIPMTWVFAEGNPFSTVTGNYDTMLKNVVESAAKLGGGSPVQVQQENAITMKFPENSILFTELPYYDNVGYADLSDYFYIWLRKSLKGTYPDLFEKVVTSKEELSSIAEHYDGDSAAAVKGYRDGIEQLCKNFYIAASEEYPSVIFFEYSKQDDRVIRAEEQLEGLSPLEHLLESITKAGFMVTALFPVRTEKPNPKFDAIRIAVVFRKQIGGQQNATRRSFINTLKRELPEKLDLMFSYGTEEGDKEIAGLGSGLAVFTKYKKVMNADGSDMSIHDALQIIHQEIEDYLSKNTDDDSIEYAVTKEG